MNKKGQWLRKKIDKKVQLGSHGKNKAKILWFANNKAVTFDIIKNLNFF